MDLLRNVLWSSSSSLGHRYQVFLSFRGKDTRRGFTDHLHTGLQHAGIHTFLDETELERGRGISTELLKAIKESNIAIIVFSTNYAGSDWCLNELVRILERVKTRKLRVIPVFYDVQPSDVRFLRGNFGKAFLKLGRHKFDSEETMNMMDKWREALIEVAELAGFVLQNEADGHEAKFIKEIVQDVKRRLNSGQSDPNSNLNLNPNSNEKLNPKPNPKPKSNKEVQVRLGGLSLGVEILFKHNWNSISICFSF